MQNQTPSGYCLTGAVNSRFRPDTMTGSGADHTIGGRLGQLIRPLVYGMAGNTQRLGQFGRGFEQLDGFGFRHGADGKHVY